MERDGRGAAPNTRRREDDPAVQGLSPRFAKTSDELGRPLAVESPPVRLGVRSVELDLSETFQKRASRELRAEEARRC